MSSTCNAEGQAPEQVAEGFLTFTARKATARRYPAGVSERLAMFAEWTGTQLFPIENVVEGLDDERTFSTDFLRFCNENGLSLDWVWLGDERSLVIEAFHSAKGDMK